MFAPGYMKLLLVLKLFYLDVVKWQYRFIATCIKYLPSVQHTNYPHISQQIIQASVI